MTLSSLLTEIAERGWLVNNLFQRDSGLWQANLRTATHACEFAIGTTMEEALSLCLDKLERTVPLIQQTCEYSLEPAKDISLILANLRPKVKIERRF